MTQMKKIGISLTALLIALPIITFIIKKELTLSNLSDTFFMVSLFFFFFGGFILVLSSGFFDLFQKNMKHLIQLRKKNEPKDYVPLSQVFKNKPVLWLTIGGTLFIISFILAFLA